MAGPSIIGALRVIIGADTDKLEDGLKKAEKSTDRFNKQFTGLDRSLTKAVAGITLAATGLLGIVKTGAQAADVIDDTSKRLGIGAEAFQEIAYAASIAGVSQEEIVGAFDQFNKRLGEFKDGGGEASNALAQLGLRFDEVRSKSPDEAFRLVADRLAAIPDPMRRAAIEADLFGRAGVQLDNVLTLGSAGLQRFADEARRMGLVLSEDTIKKAGEVDDEFTKMGAALRAAGIQVAAEFLPVIRQLREIMTSPEFVAGVRGLAGSFRDLITFLVDNKDALVNVAGAFAGMRIGVAVGRMFGGIGAAVGAATGALIGWNLAAAAATTDMEKLTARKKELTDQLNEAEASQKRFNILTSAKTPPEQIQLIRDELAVVNEQLEIATRRLALLSGPAGTPPPEGAPGTPKAIENMKLHNTELQKFLTTQRETRASLEEEALPAMVRYQNELINLRAALVGAANEHEVFAFHAEKAAERYGLSWKKQVPEMIGAFAEVANEFGKENAKMAKTAKILGAAQALISTLVGAAEAFKLGPIAGIAASALILAKGMALVAAIKAEPVPGFQHGGSFRVGGSGGIDSQMVQFRATPGEMVDVRRPGDSGTVQELVIRSNPRDIYTREHLRILFEEMNEAIGDGMKLRLSET